eukprot:6900267-Pyramimonas_sp.AAC.1
MVLAPRGPPMKPFGSLFERLGSLLGRLGPTMNVLERSFGVSGAHESVDNCAVGSSPRREPRGPDAIR